jgi:hypothetical protein
LSEAAQVGSVNEDVAIHRLAADLRAPENVSRGMERKTEPGESKGLPESGRKGRGLAESPLLRRFQERQRPRAHDRALGQRGAGAPGMGEKADLRAPDRI